MMQLRNCLFVGLLAPSLRGRAHWQVKFSEEPTATCLTELVSLGSILQLLSIFAIRVR